MTGPVSMEAWASVRRASAVLLLSIFSCTRIVDPVLDSGAEQFERPLVYARWWSMVESCSGIHGSLSDISWYQVPGATVNLDGQDVSGYWSRGSNSIVLASDEVLGGAIVRHEMLHALVRQPGHSREYFLNRCGGIVSCASACVTDAGQAPQIDASTVHASSNALHLRVTIVPESPSSSIDGGVFTLIITATNTNPYPIVVDPNPSAGHYGFFYTLLGVSGGISGTGGAVDSSVRFYASGETKSQYFDFSIGANLGRGIVSPGTYQVYGGYDSRAVTLEGVTIGP